MTDNLNLTTLTRAVIARVIPGAEIDAHYDHWLEATHPDLPVALNFRKSWDTRGKIRVSAQLPQKLRAQLRQTISCTLIYRPGEYPKGFDRNISPQRFKTQVAKVAQEIETHVLAPAIPQALKTLAGVAERQTAANAAQDCARAIAKHIRGEMHMRGEEPHVYTHRRCNIAIRFYSLGGGTLELSGTNEDLSRAARALYDAFKNAPASGP